METTLKKNTKKVFLQGHRGCPTLEPENTVIGFEKACDLGVDSVELDVFRLRDGHIAVFHGHGDSDKQVGGLDTMTTGKGSICDHTVQTLQTLQFIPHAFDCPLDRFSSSSSSSSSSSPSSSSSSSSSSLSSKSREIRIPSLLEVLEVIKRRGIHVGIELKGPDTEEGSLNAVREIGLPLSQVTFSSFEHDRIRKMKELDERVETGALFGPLEDCNFIQMAKDCLADCVHLRYDYVSKGVVERAKKEGFKVLAWMRGYSTMGEKETLDLYLQMIECGVDGLCVNMPFLLNSQHLEQSQN